MKRIKCIIRYIKHTKDIGITFNCDNEMRLIINIDASHNCSEDGKGHMCISASIDENNGYFFAQSCKIRHVTLSSSETEYTAVSIGSTNIVYLRRLLDDMEFPQVQLTVIYKDNSSCTKMLVGDLNHRTSKHNRIKYHHVKELIKEGDISLFINLQRK